MKTDLESIGKIIDAFLIKHSIGKYDGAISDTVKYTIPLNDKGVLVVQNNMPVGNYRDPNYLWERGMSGIAPLNEYMRL